MTATCPCHTSGADKLSLADLRTYGEGCTSDWICPELDRLRRFAARREASRDRIARLVESKAVTT